MAIIMCSKGHFYDNEKFFRCPYCGISMNKGEKGLAGFYEEEATEMYRTDSEEENDRTIAFWKNDEDQDYVTGWLVCISGSQKGRDYRLHYGFNRIGRSYNMDICVEDDLQITRDNHCSVVYDVKSNAFLLMPATGTVTYLNNKVLMQVEKLKTKDKIRVGESTFQFVAFCDGETKWEDDME